MTLEPITRQEQIIAGKDLQPITRMEKFLKEYGGAPSWNDLKDKPFYSETDEDGNETVHKLDAKYLPGTMFVNLLCLDDGGYGVDKSFAEIRGAILNGRNVMLYDDGSVFHVNGFNDFDVTFMTVYIRGTDVDFLSYTVTIENHVMENYLVVNGTIGQPTQPNIKAPS